MAVVLRLVGGPKNGEYAAIPDDAQDLRVAMHVPLSVVRPNELQDVPAQVRLYHRATLGWGFGGLEFKREVLMWEGIEGPDAMLILMRRFVDLLDRQEL